MKIRAGKRLWKTALALAAIIALGALFVSRRNQDAQRSVEDTRQALRKQGFKTDLSDFDFSTSSDLRAREAALMVFDATVRPSTVSERLNLMPAVQNDSAIVLWKQDLLPDDDEELHWEDLHYSLDWNGAALDTACEAALSGPIRFNLEASHGSAMLLRHLGSLKRLAQTLGSRTVLELHEGDRDAAWTNLLAITRLITAWETESVDVSHLVRFGCADIAFNTTWQALQVDGWSDEQLVHLQREWESADFFRNLPETAAFQRASAVDLCRRERGEPLSHVTLSDLIKEALRSPRSGWSELVYYWNQIRYRSFGTYADEEALLLHFQNRELELRRALQAPTWLAMRQLPGVTNHVPFISKYLSRLQIMMNQRELILAMQRQGRPFLGSAAKAEAQRRLIITAIALERFYRRHGAYPKTLEELVPELLKSPPMDFMDGQPLRYRLSDDGHFVLYSVGLDCNDDGGTITPPLDLHYRGATSLGPGQPGDLVWPRPASSAEVAALRQLELKAKEKQTLRELEKESEEEWSQSPLRQARVGKILATDWSPDAGSFSYQGQRLGDAIRNGNVSANRLSLPELLTPRQVITGGEPEDITFDLPVSYDVITGMGGLVLLVDADPDEVESPDSGAKMQECNRATNGNCLLVWHAIFDPPGRHAVQVELSCTDKKSGLYVSRGPAISVISSNLCHFSLASSHFDPETGATLQARLPELNGNYFIELKTTNGAPLKTITGSTSNGVLIAHWDLIDNHGRLFTNESFNSFIDIALPNSGRSQKLRGP